MLNLVLPDDHSPHFRNSRSADREIPCSFLNRMACYAAQGPDALDRCLAEFDREWDIERMLATNAATIALIGLGLGLETFVDRRCYLLPTAVAGFLLQHAVHGWCPPLPVFLRLGVRTGAEIEEDPPLSEEGEIRAGVGEDQLQPEVESFDEGLPQTGPRGQTTTPPLR